jgi:hypothetical protein
MARTAQQLPRQRTGGLAALVRGHAGDDRRQLTVCLLQQPLAAARQVVGHGQDDGVQYGSQETWPS